MVERDTRSFEASAGHQFDNILERFVVGHIQLKYSILMLTPLTTVFQFSLRHLLLQDLPGANRAPHLGVRLTES